MKTCGQRRCVSIILIISLLMTLSACSKSIDKFKKAVENNNSSDAIEIYNDKLSDDKDAAKEAKSFIKKYLSDALSDYASGKITDKDFEKTYKSIDKINQKVKGINNIDEILWKYTKIKASKERFSDGEKAFSSKDFSTAVRMYSQVISDDKEHFEDAQQKLQESITNYENNVLDKADKAVASGDYKGAFQTIDIAIEEIGTEKLKDYRTSLCDTYESNTIEKAWQLAGEGKYQEAYQCLTDAIDTVGNTDKLSSAYSSIYIDEYETKMKTAYEAKDYLSVFRIYAEADWIIEGSQEMMNYYNSSITEYLNDIDAKAETAFGETKDYDAAILILRNALSDVAELNIDEITSHLEERMDFYVAYAPQPLRSLEPIQDGRGLVAIYSDNSKLTKDVNGKEYNNESSFRPSIDGGNWIKYNLNYQYSTLTGTIYRPYQTLSCATEWEDYGIVRIYGDDVLIYESPKITQNTFESFEVSVDVSGIRNIEIQVLGMWTEGEILGIKYYPMLCFTEVMLHK